MQRPPALKPPSGLTASLCVIINMWPPTLLPDLAQSFQVKLFSALVAAIGTKTFSEIHSKDALYKEVDCLCPVHSGEIKNTYCLLCSTKKSGNVLFIIDIM